MKPKTPAHPPAATASPLQVLAAALNPPGGAWLDALPFSLTSEVVRTPAETQPDLFTTGDRKP